MKKVLFFCWVITVVSSLVGVATHDLEWGLVGLAGIATMLSIIGGKQW